MVNRDVFRDVKVDRFIRLFEIDDQSHVWQN